MPKYRITAPDGKKFDVTGEGTAAEALAHFQSTYSPEPPPEPEEPPPAPSPTFGQRIGQGAADLASGFADVGSALLSPVDMAYDAIKGQQLGTSNRMRRADIESFAKERGANNVSSVINRAAPEMVASGGGIAATGDALAGTVLKRALGKYAPAAADIAVNAAYEGGKSIARGDSLADAGTAALAGGGGALGGRVLTRALGGMKPLATKEAQQLIERGIYPTPGQAMGGAAASLEDKALSLPIVGDIGQLARKRSISDFGRAEVNDSIEALPVGKITATGADAVEAASKKISGIYDDALDGMAVHPGHIGMAIDDTMTAMKGGDFPLLDRSQAQKVSNYIQTRIAPLAEKGALGGTEAKAIDAEIGHLARSYSRSINPGDRPMGDALYDLQTNWRDAMARGSTPDKTELLNKANDAYRQMLPIVKAADKAMAQGGTFTPLQLARSAGQFKQQPSDLTKAAQAVLPSRVPDSGSAGRLLLGVLAGGAGTAGAGLGPTAAGGVVAAALTSRQGLNAFYNGIGSLLPAETKAYIRTLAPEAATKYLADLATRFPSLRQGMQQVASQVGRQIAASQQQPQPEEATE